VDLPNPGYHARLAPARSQSPRSGEYWLDLILTPGKGMWTQVITPRQIRYVESRFRGAYTKVVIRDPHGQTESVALDRTR
jgi:hypothetical protein